MFPWTAAAARPALGIPNCGSTCYWNSYWQLLLSCPGFYCGVVAWIHQARTTGQGGLVRPIHDAVAAMVTAADDATVAEASRRLFGEFISELRRRRPRIQFGNGQESAEEGFTLILDMLDPETVGAAAPAAPALPRFSDAFLHRYRHWVVCGGCGYSAMEEASDFGAVFDWFGIPAASTAEEFADRLLSGRSELSGGTCGKCGHEYGGVGRDGVSRRTYRHYRLRVVPEVIVVRFGIYGGAFGAPAAPVWFPPRFQLPARDGGALEYRAVASVLHSGSIHGGHYTATGLRRAAAAVEGGESAAAFYFNDQHVGPLPRSAWAAGPPGGAPGGAPGTAAAAAATITPRPDTYLVAFHYAGTVPV